MFSLCDYSIPRIAWNVKGENKKIQKIFWETGVLVGGCNLLP
nr:MAG TPA: hypothetical protein [Caudoviricetes sp.]